MKTKSDSIQSLLWETMHSAYETRITSGEYLTPSNSKSKVSRDTFEIAPRELTRNPTKAFLITIVATIRQKQTPDSLYDTHKILQDKNTNHLLGVIDDYISQSASLTTCARVSSEQLDNIRKEVLLLSPFLNKGKIKASVESSFNGLVISLSNAVNTMSIVAKGNHQVSFSYLLKESSSSIAIDGLIDLEDDDDNINFKGLEKLLSIYSGA